MKFEWIPREKLGDFEFGTPIEKYIKKYNLETLPEEYDNKVGWDVYSLPNTNVRIFVENGSIISIACYEECWYQGTNLIGLNIEEASRLIGSNPSDDVDLIYIDNEPQQVFEFEDLEAQFWVKDGKVVTIFCGPLCDE